MQIESIIVDEPSECSILKKCIRSRFPNIVVQGEASTYSDALKLIRETNPYLVFSEMSLANRIKNSQDVYPFEIVCMSHRSEDAIKAMRKGACGFLLKPLDVTEIVLSVESVMHKLTEHTQSRSIKPLSSNDIRALPHTKLIGIPTMEGIEFFYAHEIVRCEGLQKCTRIIVTGRKNMVSAYNIGEFKKLLEEYGFFSCHKSHLINLMHVNKYTKEGFVFLTDHEAVPLARRKRQEFLLQLKHL
jgi:two-component system, LytTR family, response regulator